MKYQTYKNFLAKDFFEVIKKFVMEYEFPWRRNLLTEGIRRDHMVSNITDPKKMKYQTRKKFLAPDVFEKIKNLVMEYEFPWRRRDHMVSNTTDPIFFSYCFYNNMRYWSELYEPYIIPILEKLGAKAPLQVRANLFISALFNRSVWHTDYNFKCKTAILYLNDCDGGTELKINNKIIFIKAEANKMVVFDTLIEHRAVTSKEEPVRFIINFNYYIKE